MSQREILPAYLHQNEAARFLGMSVPTLLRLVNKSQGPPRILKGKRCVMYSVEDLRAWMDKDKEQPRYNGGIWSTNGSGSRQTARL